MEERDVTPPRIRLVPVLKDGGVAEAGLSPPEAWNELRSMTVEYFEKVGYEPPWIPYLGVEGNSCVGTCAFKSAPHDGQVEIAYATFPGHEGRGVATAMALELLSLAVEHLPEGFVTAHTLPEKNASTRILEKLGFRRAGIARDEEVGEVWAWRKEL